jgi:hypothetical protein
MVEIEAAKTENATKIIQRKKKSREKKKWIKRGFTTGNDIKKE